ncbi:mediator of RNA polymerase II transcription subunit 6 isoform X3 [Aristolochia californica]|uniref:mediator of RNA polymerase II transcription subunit 6 isoform X3 n=1 Tax=Aristolochia californica TaxID=171875 RepID=UPI0035D97CCF
MAATPLPPPNPGMGAGNSTFDGNPALPPPPGTDMTGICFRDQLWLNSYPLDRNFVFDYFALSPFYDRTCNNEQLRSRSVHPLDISHLSKMTGNEYMLNEVMEPHLFVIRKQKRDGPEKVTPMLTYYVLDGSIYQAPQLSNVFAARIGRALYHISKAFTTAASKLEKIGYVPPPPPFPEGYAPRPSSDADKGPDGQQQEEQQVSPVDPIIDQGPSKRARFQ